MKKTIKNKKSKNKTLKKTIQNIKYKNGIFIYPKEFYFKNTDSNIMNAAKLLNTSLNEEVIDPKVFLKEFRENMNNFFLKKHYRLKKEYEELLETNQSNDHKLKWNVIFVQPDYNFSLHIHPNIEYIYSPSYDYSLDEKRYKYLVSDKTKIKNIPKKDFIFNKSKVIINPTNSMHNSYTKKKYSVFLVLWSGVHIIIPLENTPYKL